MKGILVIGMLYAHVAGAFHTLNYMERWERLLADLTAFSGFVFALGFAAEIAYFSLGDERRGRVRLALRGLWVLGAFYGLALIFRTLLAPSLEVEGILELEVLPIYADFLPSLALVFLIAALFYRTFDRVAALSERRFWTLILSLLAMADVLRRVLPVPGSVPAQLALLIGSPDSVSFPVLQYLPLLLLGIRFARYRTSANARGFLACTAGLGFFAFTYAFSDLTRFPPSSAWVTGSLAAVVLVFWASRAAWPVARRLTPITGLGRNVLLSVIVSDVVIFATLVRGKPNCSSLEALGLVAGIAAFVLLVSKTATDWTLLPTKAGS